MASDPVDVCYHPAHKISSFFCWPISFRVVIYLPWNCKVQSLEMRMCETTLYSSFRASEYVQFSQYQTVQIFEQQLFLGQSHWNERNKDREDFFIGHVSKITDKMKLDRQTQMRIRRCFQGFNV